MDTRIDTRENMTETLDVGSDVGSLLTYVPPQQYVDLWWGTYLGSAYPVYRALRGMYTLLVSNPVVVSSVPAVSLGDLANIAGTSREKAVLSLLSLGEEGIAYAYTSGSGRRTAYHFDVLPLLPLLSPKQVSSMPSRMKNAHGANLGLLGVLPLWHQLTCDSLVGWCAGRMARVP